MRTIKETLDASKQLSWAGVVKTDTVDLPRDYVLQRMLIDLRGTLDVVTSTSVLVEDALQRAITEISLHLTGNFAGNKTVVNLTGVDLYFINFYDYGQGLERVTPTAVATGSAVSLQLAIDIRLAKNDPDDYSIGIPLYDTSSATLKVIWDTAANGYGTNTANIAITGKITLIQGIPESKEEFAAAKSNHIYTLIAAEYDCSSSSGSVEKRNTDITTGHLLRRLFIYSKTSADARSDTEFDYLTLKKIDKAFFNELDWDALGMEDESDYSLGNYDGNRHIVGLTVLDFARGAVDERGRILGEDLTGLKSGDMKLEIYKNNASSKLRLIEEAIVPNIKSKKG